MYWRWSIAKEEKENEKQKFTAFFFLRTIEINAYQLNKKKE